MATLELQIGDGLHDAQESGAGAMTVDGANINCSGTAQYIGLIFGGAGAAALAGATINSAILQGYFTSGSFDDPDVLIRLYWAYSAVNYWTTTANELSTLWPGGGPTVAWNASSVGVGWEDSPSLVTPYQDLFTGAWGWGINSTGSYSWRMMIKGNTSGSLMRINAYDGTPSNAAKMQFDYSPAGGKAFPLYRPRQRQVYLRL